MTVSESYIEKQVEFCVFNLQKYIVFPLFKPLLRGRFCAAQHKAAEQDLPQRAQDGLLQL